MSSWHVLLDRVHRLGVVLNLSEIQQLFQQMDPINLLNKDQFLNNHDHAVCIVWAMYQGVMLAYHVLDNNLTKVDPLSRAAIQAFIASQRKIVNVSLESLVSQAVTVVLANFPTLNPYSASIIAFVDSKIVDVNVSSAYSEKLKGLAGQLGAIYRAYTGEEISNEMPTACRSLVVSLVQNGSGLPGNMYNPAVHPQTVSYVPASNSVSQYTPAQVQTFNPNFVVQPQQSYIPIQPQPQAAYSGNIPAQPQYIPPQTGSVPQQQNVIYVTPASSTYQPQPTASNVQSGPGSNQFANVRIEAADVRPSASANPTAAKSGAPATSSAPLPNAAAKTLTPAPTTASKTPAVSPAAPAPTAAAKPPTTAAKTPAVSPAAPVPTAAAKSSTTAAKTPAVSPAAPVPTAAAKSSTIVAKTPAVSPAAPAPTAPAKSSTTAAKAPALSPAAPKPGTSKPSSGKTSGK